MTQPKRHHRTQSGFTMVELAILLTILSIFAATTMMDMITGSSSRAQTVTLQRMAAIQEQLVKYYTVFYRIPCPARTDVANGNSQFGSEGGAQGSCAHATGIMQPTTASPLPKIVMGSVPTRVLNLPDEYMFDGWGRRLDYVVDIRYTAVSNDPLRLESLATLPFNVENDEAPDVVICTSTTCVVRGTYPAALMSHGSSGNRAVPLAGTTMTPDGRTSMLPSGGNAEERINVELNTGYLIHNPFQPITGNTTTRFDMIVFPITLTM